ncbi:serine carboxypeptidase-like 2 [Phragmites australis]|uniref:serine carboxypeptidase-like 2 n=1 Tax=Phragmites australis TaxID=29695 RepID=UPI002D781EE0|nr:serine carboxypeptidase-like 2 [Phragmites australis]
MGRPRENGPSSSSIGLGGPRRSPLLLLPLVVAVLLLIASSSCWCAAAEARRRNVITHIKGFEGPLPFHLETGYVEVDEEHGARLFYYFIESERNPAEDPLILWITGGPGCSALSGLLFEIGPLKFDVAGYTEGFPRLVYFQDSWTKVSNVIFLDAPVGTGFSYAREEAGLNVSLTESGRQHHTFLRKWLADHPEFASNPLYIGGDSYSGYTVPVTALDIATHNTDTDHEEEEAPKLNLVGYLVGNAATDDRYDTGGKVPFMHGMGLISDELYEAARVGCGGDFYKRPEPTNARCANAMLAINLVTFAVNPVHILEPFCGAAVRANSIFPDGDGDGGRRSMLDDLKLPVECRDNGYRLSYIWADDPEVRQALGIHDGSIGSWSRCTSLTHFRHDIATAIPYHVNLTKAGYRALVYNGDHDLDMTFVGTQAWIRSLGYPIVSDWRPWFANRQVAGFTRTYAYNLTFATVKGGGHTAPEYRPKECLAMLDRWTSPAGQL